MECLGRVDCSEGVLQELLHLLQAGGEEGQLQPGRHLPRVGLAAQQGSVYQSVKCGVTHQSSLSLCEASPLWRLIIDTIPLCN